MKKPYIEPEIETLKLSLKDNVLLIHSPNEHGGENRGWKWNDTGDEPIDDPIDDLFL